MAHKIDKSVNQTIENEKTLSGFRFFYITVTVPTIFCFFPNVGVTINI
jgi:hypothetical protein